MSEQVGKERRARRDEVITEWAREGDKLWQGMEWAAWTAACLAIAAATHNHELTDSDTLKPAALAIAASGVAGINGIAPPSAWPRLIRMATRKPKEA